MFLDMSKKPGDADCVRTAEDILAENERLKAEIERLRQPGNVAALREALIKARAAICHHARYQCQSLSWENSNVQANCGDVLCSWRGLCEAKTAINAALSAPPRNCDLARDWVRDLYAHFQPPARIKREMPPEWVDSVMAFCRWLVAPATEQEGEGDGSGK